jgi:hypothetical protein
MLMCKCYSLGLKLKVQNSCKYKILVSCEEHYILLIWSLVKENIEIRLFIKLMLCQITDQMLIVYFVATWYK